jgi:TolB-like protein/DNA-binding winged helix-turn-helix (wHTH) protein/Tfp pilus assembly protein PilF
MPSAKPSDEDAEGLWRAGDLELDVGQQRVLQAGRPVDLPKLTFDLLLVLMRSAPRFVSNEELMQRVWSGLVVSPETVTQRVKLLRDALGDDPRSPRYIEGLRGRGYRLTLPVQGPAPQAPAPLSPAALTSAAPAPVPAPTPVERSPPAWIAVTIAAGVVLLVGALLWLQRGAPKRSPPIVVTQADRTAAIFPFTSAGGQVDEALLLGLTDSILAQLSTVRGLTLIARNSSFQLDARELGLAEAGRRLGARYLIEGRIQRSGDRLRLTTNLLDAPTGRQLWTAQFDRDAGDFFGMQDAVATGVARALQAQIAGLDPALPAAPRSQNLDAHLAYLRGRALLGRTTVIGSEAAAREFERASELDPQFVPALIGLYDSRMQASSLRRIPRAEALAANQPLLAKAEALQADSGATELARAMWSEEPEEVRRALFEKGLQRDPANVRAMTAYSELLDQMDLRDEAARWLERALQIDPLWPRARFRFAQRNFPAVGSAIEQQNLRTLELDPNYYPALQRQAKYRWQMHGDLAQSIAIIERAIASDPENPWGPHTAAAFYLDINEPESAERVVQGIAVAEASTRAVRAQFRGDWRAAGEAALERGSLIFGRAERWGVATALRDYALQGQKVDEVVRFLSRHYRLPLDAEWQLEPSNFREAQMLAHLLQAQGHRSEALRRFDEVLAWIDANAFMGPVYNLRTRAQVLALKGDADAALAQLAESFREKDYTQWWYTLQFDPTWDALRSDPRFVKIAADVRAHVAAEAALLARQRQQRTVPDRRTATLPLAPYPG